GLDNYKKELDAFIKHTKSQNYNGRGNTQLAIISPIAFEDLSDKYDLPDGVTENVNLQLYAQEMREVAETNQVVFLDVFGPTSQWYKKAEQDLSADGSQLNDEGYQM